MKDRKETVKKKKRQKEDKNTTNKVVVNVGRIPIKDYLKKQKNS